jgi:hypothetical protein
MERSRASIQPPAIEQAASETDQHCWQADREKLDTGYEQQD